MTRRSIKALVERRDAGREQLDLGMRDQLDTLAQNRAEPRPGKYCTASSSKKPRTSAGTQAQGTMDMSSAQLCVECLVGLANIFRRNRRYPGHPRFRPVRPISARLSFRGRWESMRGHPHCVSKGINGDDGGDDPDKLDVFCIAQSTVDDAMIPRRCELAGMHADPMDDVDNRFGERTEMIVRPADGVGRPRTPALLAQITSRGLSRFPPQWRCVGSPSTRSQGAPGGARHSGEPPPDHRGLERSRSRKRNHVPCL